jgi:sugar phosphate isomerase/epimerase
MKLAYSTVGWRRYTIEHAMRSLADLGYYGIELAVQPDNLPPQSWTPKEARRIRRLAADLGLVISNIHLTSPYLMSDTPFEPSFMALYQTQRDKRIELICRSIDFAAEMGVGLVCFESGPLPPNLSPATGTDYLVEGLLTCLDHAEANRVRIGLEPSPDHLISGYASYLDLWHYFDGHFSFGLCFDIGNSHCLYEDTPAVIRDTPEIFHVHIKDMSERMQRDLVPGDGDIDLAMSLAALANAEFEGFVSVELIDNCEEPDVAARKSMAVLGQWLVPASAAA